MTSQHGFELEREQELTELHSTALIYRHRKTGARLLSVVNDDENKVFGITFRTPPSDSTGVAHILEHSVLCGSRKFPVKEPFVELVKGSLNTFLNAMTYPDKTCYPVASANLKDFYNLVDVYLDAVFFPRLTEQVLMQEGWHHETAEGALPLSYKGVVFNEMKGAYSSSDSLLYHYCQQSLFPDITYGLDSGGDPQAIPDLTFEQFIAFHRRYYHPSNAFAFFWGDDPPAERLALLDAYLSEFKAQDVETSVALQAPFTAPRNREHVYPASADAPAKAMVSVNFGLPEIAADPDLVLRLHVLEHILIGLPSSPLRKALMDSGLGEDLAGAGLEDELRQLYFSVGLKGLAPEDTDKVEPLVLETLAGLARDGIPAGDLEAALNSVEFWLRENNTGSYPRGLVQMFRALSTWLHDGDPLALLPYERPLAELRRDLEGGRVFEELIQRHLVDNPYRTRVVLGPDPELSRRWEEAERRQLEMVESELGSTGLVTIARAEEELRERQEAADSPEALATIPRLAMTDLPAKNAAIPITAAEVAGRPLLYHDLPTNGIAYLDVGFDLSAVPDDLLPYVPILSRALLETGTARQDFIRLTQRIACKTGGISPQMQISSVRDSPDASAFLFLRGKATLQNSDELIAILSDVLTGADLGNRERISQIVLEGKARREQHLIPAGHQLVATRLRARFDQASRKTELMSGISNLFFVRQLAVRVEQDFEAVQADLERLRSIVVTKRGLLLNLTVEEKGSQPMQRALEELCQALPASSPTLPDTHYRREYPAREGLTLPAQVGYVGKGARVGFTDGRLSGAANVVSRYLGTTYLWDKVRVLGGAYGCFSLFDRMAGSLCFVSYRDPNLDETVAAYDGVGAFLRQNPVDPKELEKSVIGSIGDIDSYRLPDAKGYVSMIWHLRREDDAYRQMLREEVLGTTPADFVRFAELAETVARDGEVVVLGSEEAVKGSVLGLQATRVL